MLLQSCFDDWIYICFKLRMTLIVTINYCLSRKQHAHKTWIISIILKCLNVALTQGHNFRYQELFNIKFMCGSCNKRHFTLSHTSSTRLHVRENILAGAKTLLHCYSWYLLKLYIIYRIVYRIPSTAHDTNGIQWLDKYGIIFHFPSLLFIWCIGFFNRNSSGATRKKHCDFLRF